MGPIAGKQEPRAGRTRARFPKAERLRRRSQFLAVQRRGRGVGEPRFRVVVLERPDAGPARLGVTVTKKVGGAVVRNRIKRLVREVYRRNKDWFPAGRDVVVIARDGAPGASLEDVAGELERALGRSRR
jgi:ribonuclease P protein component